MERVFGYFPKLRQRFRQQAGTLSGGEQQMLAIGRALLLRPRLLLLDEPSFGLAPLIVREIFDIMRRIREEDGVGILLVEQNASLALELADQACLLETGRIVASGPAAELRARRERPPLLPGRLSDGRLNLQDFLHQLLAGIASGGIYASVALALVMIFQATHHVNFAQGEMAMFSTYIALALIEAGLPYWVAFALTVAVSFVIGAVIQRVLLTPMAGSPVLASVGVFIGLLLIFNSARRLAVRLHAEAVPLARSRARRCWAASSPGTISARSRSRWRCCWRCGRSSASPSSAWRCAPRPTTRSPAG